MTYRIFTPTALTSDRHLDFCFGNRACAKSTCSLLDWQGTRWVTGPRVAEPHSHSGNKTNRGRLQRSIPPQPWIHYVESQKRAAGGAAPSGQMEVSEFSARWFTAGSRGCLPSKCCRCQGPFPRQGLFAARRTLCIAVKTTSSPEVL